MATVDNEAGAEVELTDGGLTAATATFSSPLFVGLDDLNLPGRFPDPWRHNADARPQILLPSPFPISALSPISPHLLRAVEGGWGVTWPRSSYWRRPPLASPPSRRPPTTSTACCSSAPTLKHGVLLLPDHE
jgi:hypothetical protein